MSFLLSLIYVDVHHLLLIHHHRRLLKTASPSKQTIEGYSFEKYKVEIHSVNEKAEINFSSNPFWKHYRTRISKGYKNGNVDFGGYYIAIIIGCGVGCRLGAMVDIRDGKIYDLPLGGMSYAECYYQ